MPKSKKNADVPIVKKALAKVAKVKATKPVKPEIKTANVRETGHKGSKQGILITLLERTGGATVDEMVKATGWQSHSVLGAISGALRKRLGLSVTSEKEERGRVYRIASAR